jgi:hypothetical protein
MPKILITSIGSGNYNAETKAKTYKTAKYYGKDSSDICETAYIYEALLKFYQVDKIRQSLSQTTDKHSPRLRCHGGSQESKPRRIKFQNFGQSVRTNGGLSF